MILYFQAGVNLFALIIGAVYLITQRQSRRCSTNVNEINNCLNAILLRQAILAERAGVELPPMEEVTQQVSCSMPGACTPVGWRRRVGSGRGDVQRTGTQPGRE